MKTYVETKTTTNAIPLLQTTAAMILKSQDQRTHIWCHHSDTYHQQPLATATSDNGRLINIIPSTSIEEPLGEVRLQKYVQFKEYQRLHLGKKKSQENPDFYPPNTCILMGDSILNGVIERNLTNDWSIKVKKFPRATVNNLQHHALRITWKEAKYLIIHARINDTVKFTSRDILNKLLQLKFFILEKFPGA